MVQDNPMNDLIVQSFKDSKEVHEVAAYCLSTLQISDAMIRGIITGKNVEGISPELLMMTRRLDWGLTHNEFYMKYFAIIRTQLSLEDIKLSTSRCFSELAVSDKSYIPLLKSLLLSRLDILTTLMMLYKGVGEAELFDMKLRKLVQLSSEHQEFFSNG